MRVKDESENARTGGRVSNMGTETGRLEEREAGECSTRGFVKAGNEAEGDTRDDGERRMTQLADRRIGFGGGVGGVAFHVGAGRRPLRRARESEAVM